MATIASKHLSNVAQQGRGGDDSLRFVDGELSHVNRQEAKLIDYMGKDGERLVQNIGSGTINPNTGLREYNPALLAAVPMISAGVAVAGLALQGYSSFKSGQMQEDASKAKMLEAEEGMKNLDLADAQLDRSVISQRKLVEEEYRLSNQSLAGQSQSALITSGVQGDEIKQNVDMSFSGTATQQINRSEQDITRTSRQKQQGLISQLGKNVGDILGDYYGEKQRIKSEREKMQGMYDLSKKQSDSWYLGKHVGKALAYIPGGRKGGWKD